MGGGGVEGGKGNEAGNVDISRSIYLTLRIDPESTLTYDTGLELHHPIMSNIEDHRFQKEGERERLMMRSTMEIVSV